MEQEQYWITFAEIASRLENDGIKWVVFAGAAATVYGAARPISDIDLLVEASAGGNLGDLFPEGKVCYRPDGSVEGVAIPCFDILVGWRRGYEIDVDDEMMSRRTHADIAGLIVPVIPVEDNILLKAIWGRGPELGKHDWEDVGAMMTGRTGLDWDYLHYRAHTGLKPERAQQILERLEQFWCELAGEKGDPTS